MFFSGVGLRWKSEGRVENRRRGGRTRKKVRNFDTSGDWGKEVGGKTHMSGIDIHLDTRLY